MPRKPPARLPITPATVTVNYHEYRGTDTIWAILRINDAEPGWMPTILSVPTCHPDDNLPNDNCGRFFIRPRDRYADYRFAKQANGNWMLVRGATDV